MVCFLDVSPDEAAKRGNYGDERYEKQDFQAKVRENYKKFNDENWVNINTDGQTPDEIFDRVKETCLQVINRDDHGPIRPLWPM